MMKKSIFAVAVASALTLGAAQAETVLYGSIRYDYESSKNYTDAGNNKFNSERLSNLSDAGSRIGLKGSEDLGNGFAVIYNLEYGFDGMTQDEKNSFKTRKAILGVTSDFGTITAGRQDNPFKVTIVDDSVQDDFNGSSVISSASQRAMTTTLKAQGPAFGTKYDADFSRVGKVIAYTTPEFAGFQANAAVMMDSDLYPTNSRKNADLWTINAKYAYDVTADGQILAKLGYIQGKVAGGFDEDGNAFNANGRYSSKAWGLFLGYISDSIKVSASYADGNHKIEHGDKQKSKGWDLGASYSFGPNYFSTVRATYGQSELKQADAKDKVKSWAVGFEQKLSTRTRAWVEYGQEETKYAEANSEKRKDNVISIGMRHDF
ncbi:MAG TPA: porin [Candidatus Ignatzschineria merdigallinarum]|uniref:Porin n=1 Tax=Candidatus Ignatzschineria merdigallinarum TaxID=2838621 RepID=A0A9D1Q768_9GAMM|nr:porin [Candidatus Ignatzschineria merdigallinarum]